MMIARISATSFLLFVTVLALFATEGSAFVSPSTFHNHAIQQQQQHSTTTAPAPASVISSYPIRSTQRHSSSSNVDQDATTTTTIWTEQQLMEYASKEGVVLSLTTLGPGYRAVVRAKHNETIILGYCEGFLRPGGKVLHLDKMEVFKKTVKLTAKQNPDEFRGGGTLLGVGQLMGYLCLLHGKSNGYTVGEFLAIDDEDKQHRKLVQYYKRSGFKIIKYVGDGAGDIPDRLVWGGRGTLMRESIDTLLTSWTRVFQKTAKP
jgi:hypothetical protein